VTLLSPTEALVGSGSAAERIDQFIALDTATPHRLRLT
jgi:hypothetical protein